MAARPRKKEHSISINERILDDPVTQEKIKASEIEIIEPGVNLTQTWFNLILQLSGILSPSRTRLVKFMLGNMITNENILIMTQREIAQKSGISYPTVAATIQELKKLGIVETKTGAVRFITDRIIQGDDKEMYILLKFRATKAKQKANKGGDEK